MQFDLSNMPYIFATGFFVTDENIDTKACYAFNRLLEDLFNMRFNKSYQFKKQPSFSNLSDMSFVCTLTTNTRIPEEKLRAAIDVTFKYSNSDLEREKFSLICDKVSNFKIVNLEDPDTPTTCSFAEWANGLSHHNLHVLEDNLERLLNANLSRMKSFLELEGFDLFDTLKAHFELQRKLSSTYSLITVNLSSNPMEVNKSYVVRSVEMVARNGTDFLRKAYLMIGKDCGLEYPVVEEKHKYLNEIEGYRRIDFDEPTDVVLWPEFHMTNLTNTAFLKIKQVLPLTLEEVEAARKVQTTVFDLDTNQTIGV